MKKILVLVDAIGKKKELFTEGIGRGLPEGYSVSLVRFSDLSFHIDGKKISIKVDGINEEITNFGLIYFRRVGTRFFSLAGTLAICLDSLNIRFFDTTFRHVGPDEDKFTNLTRLSLAGLPVMPTFFCWHNKIEEKEKEIMAKFGLPLIAKQLSSHRGKGVYLIKRQEDFKLLAKDFPDGEFLFQKFYENDEEYRILVLGGTIGAFEKKIRTDPNEFRSNVALGAREEFVNIKKIPQEMKKIAIEAARVLNIEVAGVDILVDKKGRNWLLEVNRGPGLTYDSKVSPELSGLASFFTRELRKIND
ncbi:MAG: hypothetical protein Q8P91_01790 [bacterium]|nr:hypothetical protein [bacterium]